MAVHKNSRAKESGSEEEGRSKSKNKNRKKRERKKKKRRGRAQCPGESEARIKNSSSSGKLRDKYNNNQKRPSVKRLTIGPVAAARSWKIAAFEIGIRFNENGISRAGYFEILASLASVVKFTDVNFSIKRPRLSARVLEILYLYSSDADFYIFIYASLYILGTSLGTRTLSLWKHFLRTEHHT